MADGVRELMQRYSDEVYGKGNVDMLDEICTPDFICHDSLQGPLNLEENKRLVRELLDAFDPDVETEDIMVDGDRASMRWRMEGTHKREFAGVPPTGKRVVMEGVSQVRLEDGKVAEQWDFYDALGLMQQLGAIALRQQEASRPAEQAEPRSSV